MSSTGVACAATLIARDGIVLPSALLFVALNQAMLLLSCANGSVLRVCYDVSGTEMGHAGVRRTCCKALSQ